MDREKGEKGTALIEMAIVAPLLLFLVLAGLQYSKVLDRAQWATQLSREVANLFYRECSSREKSEMGTCLDVNVLNDIRSNTGMLAPGTQFVVAVFTYNETRNSAGRFVSYTVRRETILGNDSYKTRFRNEGGFKVRTLRREIDRNVAGSAGMALKKNKMLVIATTYIPHQAPKEDGITPAFTFMFPGLVTATTII